MSRNKYRLIGKSKKTGKRMYVTFKKYKNQIFCSFNESPSNYRAIEAHDFIQVQMMAQAKLKDIVWESTDATLQRRANISAGNTYRAVQKTNRRTSV